MTKNQKKALMNSKKDKPKPKWAITTNRFVAFIDIMGFKEMVMRNTHESVYKMMKSIDSSTKFSESIWTDDSNEQLIKSALYSDSIMLYSRNNSLSSFDALIKAISTITNDLFDEGIPHKGAVAYGRMTLDSDRSIYFGQPLIDSYLLEEELHFYGVILHGTVEERLKDKIDSVSFVTKYQCPLKKGVSSHYTVHPMHGDSRGHEDYGIRYDKLVTSLEAMKYKTSGSLRRYIDNTRLYFEHVSNLS